MAKCRLTERIIIEEYISNNQNENGFDIEKWPEYYSCWCNYKTVNGKEYEAAKATQAQNIVTFTVRYCNKIKALLEKDATKKFRIKYKDKIFNIEYVNDFQNRHEWIDIKATEV
ncbi:phage head closure protein [Hathewaya limosa]|uniref:SPP1 family predicted phage head-tail adaptor n=1 Tax=Hathewaya limosa TaxID=1536 RepID=A0ABU0JUB8_HATLI|nr:phage head closure protein [Hathewaya limosa]AWZ48317.1 head-tail adaptor protein [Clostridiaceae bacterium 14S0207]MDQ0479723.1 SPP1 family predicted phage head-tail adaptor [Hathewaya limosa]